MSAHLEKPKPGLAAAILIPLVIWVVFSVVATVFLVRGFQSYTDIIDDFARVESGQQATVSLKSGGFRVWIERSALDEDVRPPTTVTVEAADGTPVQVDQYDLSTNLTYSDGDTEGQAVHTFNIDEPGDYTITATADDGQPAEFAIGKDNPVSEIGKGFALFFGIGIVGFLIALILLIVMLVKRGRSKKRITQARFAGAQQGYPAYGAQGGYGAPGYGAPGGYGGQQGWGTPPPPR